MIPHIFDTWLSNSEIYFINITQSASVRCRMHTKCRNRCISHKLWAIILSDSSNVDFNVSIIFLWKLSPIKALKCKVEATTQSTTQSMSITNPNTHHFCEIKNTWTDCSQCYPYEHHDDYFFDRDTYKYYEGEHTCIYSISTVCDSNFVDTAGRNCDYYASRSCRSRYSQWYLDMGVMSDVGYMTGLNCPQCGCDENGPIRPDFATLPL